MSEREASSNTDQPRTTHPTRPSPLRTLAQSGGLAALSMVGIWWAAGSHAHLVHSNPPRVESVQPLHTPAVSAHPVSERQMNADERPAAVAVLSRTSSQGNRTDVGVARVQAGTRVRSTSEPASFAVPQRATDTVPKRELGEFIVTAYALTPRSTGKVPGQPGFGVTASGTRAQVGRTIAVDPSVIPMGSLVYIDLPGVGWRLAEDTGGAIQGRHIDLLLPSDNAALSFGVKRKVHVYIVAR